jgi:hypothetical protein
MMFASVSDDFANLRHVKTCKTCVLGLNALFQGNKVASILVHWNQNDFWELSYGPPWAHYLGGYQDRLLGGPLGLPGLRCTTPDGVKHKDYRGEVLG